MKVISMLLPTKGCDPGCWFHCFHIDCSNSYNAGVYFGAIACQLDMPEGFTHEIQ